MISWHVQGPEENNERSSQQNDLKIVQKVTQFSSSFLLCNPCENKQISEIYRQL